jgi:hypothetical protein
MNLTEYRQIKPRKKYEYLEYELQKSLAQYLELQYPDVLFESSPINLRLTRAQRGMMAAINKRGFHSPDLKIYEARHGYHAMFLELKKESPYKINGELKKDEHLQAQDFSMTALAGLGYWARFYWEFGTAKKAIDWYLRDGR